MWRSEPHKRTHCFTLCNASEVESLICDVCVFRNVCTVRMQQQPSSKRTFLIWTWATWGRRWVKRTRTSRANQKSLSLNKTLAPEHTPTCKQSTTIVLTHSQLWTLIMHTHLPKCGWETNSDPLNLNRTVFSLWRISGCVSPVLMCVLSGGLLTLCSS